MKIINSSINFIWFAVEIHKRVNAEDLDICLLILEITYFSQLSGCDRPTHQTSYEIKLNLFNLADLIS